MDLVDGSSKKGPKVIVSLLSVNFGQVREYYRVPLPGKEGMRDRDQGRSERLLFGAIFKASHSL